MLRHGRGRGRLPRYMGPALASLRRRSPALAARIRVHDTGQPLPSLDGAAALVIWLADPLREHFPDCFEVAAALAAGARSRGIPVLNPPEALSNTVKSRQARLWREAGLDTPPCTRFEDLAELRALAPEIGFPLILRGDEEHNQDGTRVLRSEGELAALGGSELRLPGAAAPLWDSRESWRAREPEGLYARLHHKRRLYVLGDRVRTEHVFFARSPVVGSKTCTFRRLHKLPRWARRLALLRGLEREALREDVDYWRREQEHTELMLRATRALGLGFAAIDYSQRADGSAILWEANPYPSLPPLEKMRIPDLRQGAVRLESYHRAIGDFLLGLLATP